MDYLDPKKKKTKKIRLMIGYALLGIAISIATVVFVYLANGYYIDRETGVVIQNGLIYLDSKPESATVHLNGVQQGGQTDARLVVPEGDYTIELKRDGYLTWSRELILEGGSLRRLTYARLIPEELESELAVNLPAIPSVVSQSNDKRWLVMGFNGDSLRLQQVDLNRAVLQLREIPLPVDLLTPAPVEDPGVWKILEWADDHRTFLAEYRTSARVEYVLIDRADPESSVNITKTFATTPFTSAAMRDRKNDLVFLHDNATGTVYRANTTSGGVEVYVRDVIDYAPFGNSEMLYVTAKGASEGNVKAMLRQGDTEYELRQIKKDKKYLLDMSKIGNALVMGVGSAAEGRVIVYNDPVNAINNNDFSTLPVPTTVLRVSSPEELTISSDSSVIVVRGGQEFAAHEFEDDRTYKYTVDSPVNPSQELRWMDGQHFMVGIDSSTQLVSDFNGSNQFELSPSQPALGSIYDGPIDELFTFLPPAAEGSPPRLMRTFMRTPADR